MTDRQLQFRVGLFVLVALGVAGAMVFQFGDFQRLWRPRYKIIVHFDAAPGVHEATPVRRNGVAIGQVTEVFFDEERGGVTVIVEIGEEHRLSADSEPRLVRSLLGDASIEFTPGTGKRFLASGARLQGKTPEDPMQIIHRIEERLALTVESFHATSREWEEVGRNLNGLLDTNRGNLNVVVERAAESLHEFTRTMKTAHKTLASTGEIVADPEIQKNLRTALQSLPQLVEDTRQTVTAVRAAIEGADASLKNLNQLTAPLAERSASIVTRLDSTLGHLASLSKELDAFAKLSAREGGTLHQFAANPELYRNLNRSASSLAVLLKNLDPAVRDLRIFADKVARHPELLGVSGAITGSSGLKDPPEELIPYRTGQGPAPDGLQRR